jgi:hypothetical protein
MIIIYNPSTYNRDDELKNLPKNNNWQSDPEISKVKTLEEIKEIYKIKKELE